MAKCKILKNFSDVDGGTLKDSIQKTFKKTFTDPKETLKANLKPKTNPRVYFWIKKREKSRHLKDSTYNLSIILYIMYKSVSLVEMVPSRTILGSYTPI